MALDAIPYLFKVPAGAYRVLGQSGKLTIDEHFSGKNARSDALQAAKLFKEEVDSLTKGFLTRAELGERLGIKADTIEKAKINNSRLWQQIKELMDIKKGGLTSPEYYKFKKNPTESLKTLKKFSGYGGVGLPRITYRGKKTAIARIKDFLNKSKTPLDIKQVSNKFKDIPYATIETTFSDLKKDKNFKNKIRLVSPQEVAKTAAQTKLAQRAPYIKLVRDVFVADPDAKIGDVAEGLFGTKTYQNASKVDMLAMEREASGHVIKFLETVGSKSAIATIKGFKDISPDKLGDILESIQSRVTEFGFEAGSRRQLQWAIADAIRGLPPGHSLALITKLRSKGFHIDEVIPMGSVFKDAPGYLEATQKIPDYINTIKGTTLDAHFGRIFKNVLKGDFSGVEAFNEASRDFAKEWKIDTPIIRTGKGLKPADFVANFDKYTKAGQKNILQLSQGEKGFVIETRSNPLQYIIKEIKNLEPGSAAYRRICGMSKYVMGGVKAAGGRVGYKAAGAVGSCPIIPALEAAPEQTMNELSKLRNQTGVLGRIGNAARGFLGALGKFGPKVGKFGALAAVGAVAQPLVRQFMNDDPSTYLTDPEQMKGMLLSTIEGERPKPRSEILDWSLTGAGVGATASAIPGMGAVYRARRKPFTRMVEGVAGKKVPQTRPGMGVLRSATIGPAMKLVSGMFTPAGLLATEPLRIAQKRREGESWGEIAKDPVAWMGPAFAPSMTRMATRGMKAGSGLATILRLGLPRAAMGLMGPIGWAGLAISTGLTGYDLWNDYKKKRGFFASDED